MMTFTAAVALFVAAGRADETPAESPPPKTFTPVFTVGDGGGGAWADFNHDGWVDLYAGNHVWLNDQGELKQQAAVGNGAVWGDFDNDGFVDLAWPGGHFARNNAGTFEPFDVADMPTTGAKGIVWGDFNNDGYLDVYTGGYEKWPELSYPDAMAINVPDEAQPGGRSFKKVWQQPEEDLASGQNRARGITAADFDEDGDLDIYVSNYRLAPNILWRNEANGEPFPFTNVAAEYGVAGDTDGSMPNGHTIGSAFGDVDNDGHLDLLVGNFRHDWGDGTQDHVKFLRNLGPDGGYKFELRHELKGDDWQESYASPAFGDYDNDGDLDLLMTTVYGHNHTRLYRNDGDWTFTNVTDEVGLGSLPPTYQAAWGDFDNDGDLDLAVAGRVFRNNSPAGNWVKLTLIGDGEKVNRSAIGSQVRLFIGEKVLTRQVEGGTGEFSQNELTLHFGLGEHSGEVKCQVVWPDGSRRQLSVPSNRHLTILHDLAEPQLP